MKHLRLFEYGILDWLVDRFIGDTGMELNHDAFATSIFGSDVPMKVVGTHYGLALLVWVSWSARTNTGSLDLPVIGMNDEDLKGLLQVDFALINTASANVK